MYSHWFGKTVCCVACFCADCVCENWRRCDNVFGVLSWAAEVWSEGWIDKLRCCILHWSPVSSPGQFRVINCVGCQSSHQMTNSSHQMSWLCDELTARFWWDDPYISELYNVWLFSSRLTVDKGHGSKPAKTKVKSLKLRMSRPTYGQTACHFCGLFIAVVIFQKFRL